MKGIHYTVLTKDQKKEQVALGVKAIKNSKSLVFADFTGVPTGEMLKLKNTLRAMGGKFQVFKKRLLNIALKDAGVAVDTTKFESQLGTVFAPKSIYDVASIVQKFAKELLKTTKKEFKILGCYDAAEAKVFDALTFQTIAKLPPREVLLAQIAMMLTMPIKKVMVGLNARKELVLGKVEGQLEKTTA